MSPDIWHWSTLPRFGGLVDEDKHHNAHATPAPLAKVRARCGIIGADAQPHWGEQPPRETLTGAQWR